MRDGVPYLNKEKAENLKTYLKSNRHFMNTAEYLDPVSLRHWKLSIRLSVIILKFWPNQTLNLIYVFAFFLKCYFPRRLQMLNDEDIEDIVSHLAGFAKVIDLIQASQKPVIGHNFYTDLLLTHQLFYSNLPSKSSIIICKYLYLYL